VVRCERGEEPVAEFLSAGEHERVAGELVGGEEGTEVADEGFEPGEGAMEGQVG
jgi:hypothetical protein